MRRFRLTPLRLVAAVIVGVVACTGVAYAASLGVSSAKLHAWSQTLTKAACNQTSTTEDDTFVQQSNVTKTNAGSATLTIIGGAHPDYAFIRFTLTSCNLPTTGGADSATLNVVVNAKSNDTISVFPVYSSWSSATLDWTIATAGGFTIGSTATTTFVPSTNGATVQLPVTADVDAAIKAGTLWGWALEDTSGPATTKINAAHAGNAALRPTLTLNDEK
jgi:hypothetical protein